MSTGVPAGRGPQRGASRTFSFKDRGSYDAASTSLPSSAAAALIYLVKHPPPCAQCKRLILKDEEGSEGPTLPRGPGMGAWGGGPEEDVASD